MNNTATVPETGTPALSPLTYMDRQEFFEFHTDFCRRMNDMVRKKNEDYGGGSPDAHANFKAADEEWTEIGFYTRMMDKMMRIKSFIKKGKLENEGIQDSLEDLVNYSILFSAYLTTKRHNA